MIKLSSHALACIASKINESNCETFREKLKSMTNLDNVLSGIGEIGQDSDEPEVSAKQMNEILNPFLTFIETIANLDLTKDFIDCNKSKNELLIK